MMARSQLTRAVVWINIVLFAFLLGGNLYEQSVIVAYWADNPPQTLLFWRDIMQSGHFTFYFLTPLAILTAIVGLGLGWSQRQLRWPLLIAAVSIVLVLALTLVFAVPILKVLFPREVTALGSAAELSAVIWQFKLLSWVRWAVLFAGFVALLQAFHRGAVRSADREV